MKTGPGVEGDIPNYQDAAGESELSSTHLFHHRLGHRLLCGEKAVVPGPFLRAGHTVSVCRVSKVRDLSTVALSLYSFTSVSLSIPLFHSPFLLSSCHFKTLLYRSYF